MPLTESLYTLALRALRPALALPIERVLVSHGEPVLSGGRAALATSVQGTFFRSSAPTICAAVERCCQAPVAARFAP